MPSPDRRTDDRLTNHATDRRGFLARVAALGGVAGALALDPAALRRAADRTTASPTLPAQAGRQPSLVAREPSLNHLAWVWQFSQDGSKEAMRGVLAEHGLGVALKTHDGTDWMARYDPSPDAVDGPERVAQLAAFFEEGGVPFHAWSVVHGVDPLGEARLAGEVLAAGARSIALDLEPHPGFWRGTPETAAELGRELRRLQPNAWVVASIDARPWEVDRIPLGQFSAFVSEIAPQVYWSAFGTPPNVRKFAKAGYPVGDDGVTPRFVLDAAVESLRPFGLPVHPIGDGTRAEESEWDEFIERAFASDAESVSVWRYGVTAPAVWRLLKESPPRPLSYAVQSGDTLGVLAERWRTSVDAISSVNGIADPNLIFVGQQLRVPRGAAARPAAAQPQPALYTVQPGDTLSVIAERFDASAGAIAELNGITNPNLLRVGQELRIPAGGAGGAAALPPAPPQPTFYTVQPGDNLTVIAARFGTTVEALAALNGIANPNLVPVGLTLRIP